MKSITGFKRGDTFSLACIYKVDGTATSVSAFDIDSQIRDSQGNLIQTLTATKMPETGSFTLTADAEDTTLWPVSVLKCDLQFSESGIVRSTETFNVVVVNEITK
jgi:hypothetical protein